MSITSLDEHFQEVEEDLTQVLLIQALKKEKKESKDVDRILESIRELEFFKTLFAYQTANEEICYELCANMKHEFIDMGHFVFKEGDSCNGKFYVILSGEIGVVVHTQVTNIFEKDKEKIQEKRRISLNLPSVSNLSEEDSEKSIMLHTQASLAGVPSSLTSISEKKPSLKLAKGAIMTPLASVSTVASFAVIKSKKRRPNKYVKSAQSEEPEDRHAEYREMVKRYGNLARVLAKGDSFGESAITNPGLKRTASILCKTDCHFLIIDEQLYKAHLQRSAERKTEILMRTFAFLTQIRSIQVRNLLVNNFQTVGHAKGDIITMEGPPQKRPYFYVLDHGVCKVEKGLVIETKNPFNKDEIFHRRVRWIPICTIGNGTIAGEEILLQPLKQERYEYKVTVISKTATFLRTDKSFLGIHPDLENPIQEFYQTKKVQRDEIYRLRLEEFNVNKKFSLSNPENFLKEHTTLAAALRKPSLDSFSLRNKRVKGQFEFNVLPKKPTGNLAKTHSQNGASRGLTDRAQTMHQLRPEAPLKDLHLSQLSAVDQPCSARNNANHNFGATGLSFASNTLIENMLGAQEKQQNRNPKDNEMQNLEGKTISKDALSKRPITAGHSKKHLSTKSEGIKLTHQASDKLMIKKIDTNPSNENLDDEHIARDSPQLLAQINYLNSKEDPIEVDTNQVSSFKFIFSRHKGEKALEILKQKRLMLGVFASHKKIDYLQHHQHSSPVPVVLRRLSQDRPHEFVLRKKLFTESAALARSNVNSPVHFTSPPNLDKTDPRSQKATTGKIYVRKASFSTTQQNFFGQSQFADYGIQTSAAANTKTNEEGTARMVTPRQQDPGNLTSRTLTPRIIHNHADLTKANKTCKNGFYANLLQKGINNKKLFQRRKYSDNVSNSLKDFQKGNTPQIKVELNFCLAPSPSQ